MEHIEVNKQLSNKIGEASAAIVKPPESRESSILPPQNGGTTSSSEAPSTKTGCGSVKLNGGGAYPYVYAIGRVMARFPSIGIEKEFFQATGRAGKETVGLTDPKAFHKVLSNKENRYLVRKLCWVLTIEGIDTYILQPRNAADFEALVEAIRPAPSHMDIDVVIGVKGPIAPPEMCNGLMVPIMGFDQMYSFDLESLLEDLKEKRPEKMSEEGLTETAKMLLNRIMQLADNAGSTDEHRALNYLAVRYDAIYTRTTEMHDKNFSLTGVEVGQSRLSGTRKIVAPILSYTHRENGVVEKCFVRVDVTEEFPFLVTPLSPYYDR